MSRPVPAALRLGYAGLIPFVLGALLVWGVRDEARAYAALSMSAYAAAIVAFLGGIHWGLGFLQPGAWARAFAWGVVPSLVACVAVVMPARAGLVVHGAMLVGCYLVDRRTYPLYGLGGWLTLRFRLSAVAALSCFIAAGGL